VRDGKAHDFAGRFDDTGEAVSVIEPRHDVGYLARLRLKGRNTIFDALVVDVGNGRRVFSPRRTGLEGIARPGG
jgi:hypothetical protein